MKLHIIITLLSLLSTNICLGLHVSLKLSRKTVPTIPYNAMSKNASRNVINISNMSSTTCQSTTLPIDTPTTAPSPSPPLKTSPAAEWHQQRRKQMLTKYGPEIKSLERDSHGLYVGIPLLLLANISLASLALYTGMASLPWIPLCLLAVFPGSMFSLWQLQILHDCLHGSLLPSSSKKNRKLQDGILFWASMPSAFGYYLYLKYGHLSHHRSVGDKDNASLERLFDSSRSEFEDGDVLFVAHRMKLKGGIGPTLQFPNIVKKWSTITTNHHTNNENNKNQKYNDATDNNDAGTWKLTMSISNSGFQMWKQLHPVRNAIAFTSSFLFERIMLVFNDGIVALTGRNFFFPNKPDSFHKECATYCRCAVMVRAALCILGGFSWKPLVFLYLCETLWSLPPHPACAMFVTNHGSKFSPNNNGGNDHESSSSSSSWGTLGMDGGCIPSYSTYAGRWYSLFTLGTNYHCEHHDFPNIPLHKLGKLREIAPEYYRRGSNDNLLHTMRDAFSTPDFYACMDASTITSAEVEFESGS